MNPTALFLGDSITASFNLLKYFPSYSFINKAVSGDSTTECLARIDKSFFNVKFDFVFLCIGTNDLARDRENNEIVRNIENIISKLSEYTQRTTIVLTTIFPTRDNVPRPNSRIIQINDLLKEKVEILEIVFLNLYYHFIDLEEKLKEEFTEDGLHLTEIAYTKWANELGLFFK